MNSSILLFFIACGNVEKETDTGTIINDTGSTDPNDYESGCITIDGGDGFASFSDAMLFAENGSVITLVDCEDSVHEEAIIIDKSITFIGSADWTLDAPVNETAITITATDVTLQDINISSTRNAIILDGAINTALTNINVSEAGNWAIKAQNSTDTIIDGVVFDNNGFGGINVLGGNASIDNATLDFNSSFGVKLEEGAEVTISNSTISNTVPADTVNQSDGIGILLQDTSNLTGSNLIIDNNLISGVQFLNSNVTLSDTVISNSIGAGVWGDIGFGDISLTNVQIQDAMNYGIVSQSTGSVTITDSIIQSDPEQGPNTAADDWADAGFTGTGVLLLGSNIDITNTEVTGYNNCGMYLLSNETESVLTMDGVHVHDNGRQGAFVFGYEATIDNSIFEGTQDLDNVQASMLSYEICLVVDKYANFIGREGDFTFNNTTLQNSAAYGMSLVQSTSNMSNMVFDGNYCAGLMSFGSSAIIDSSEMRNPNGANSSFGASIIGYSSSYLKISNSDLQPEGGPNNNFHVFVFKTSTAEFIGNTISGGSYGIYSLESELIAHENSFVDQNLYGSSLYLTYDSDNPTSSLSLQHEFRNNNFSTIYQGTRGISCDSSGSIDASGDTYTDHAGGALINANNCSTVLEDITLENTNQGISVSGGNHEWESLTINNVAQTDTASGALQVSDCPSYICDTPEPVFVTLSNSTFSNIGNLYADALRFNSYNPTEAPIEAYIDNLSFDAIGGDGLYLYNATAQASNLSFTGVQGEGIYLTTGGDLSLTSSTFTAGEKSAVYCSGGNANIDNIAIDQQQSNGINISSGTVNLDTITLTDNGVDSGSNGILMSGGDLIANNLTISGSGGYGISAQSSATLSIENTSIDTSTLSGLQLDSTSASISTTTLTENMEYGMVCGTAEDVTCSQISHDSNYMGEQIGCDLTCGAEPAEEPIEDGSE